jgi:hypothetical protein
MKITELIGIKNQTRDLPKNPGKVAQYPLGPEWHKALYNKGFNALGSGSFGTVWSHPKLSYVLKVFSDTDVAYIDWISTAQQHKDNPHMPKFVSPRLMRIVPGVVAIRTEKLSDISQSAYEILTPIQKIIDTAVITKTSPGTIIVRKGMEMESSPKYKNFMAYCRSYPDFVPALDILAKFIGRPGYRQDLHDENIMMRGPVMVFTDPVFDKNSLLTRPR